MEKTIQQAIRFPVPPSKLYKTYLDSRRHGLAIGAKASIRAQVGARFTAWDGYISGKNLVLLPNRRIVQTWRASDWSRSEADSILILNFESVERGTLLHMVHACVPESRAAEIAKGWHDYYWRPWKTYLKQQIR